MKKHYFLFLLLFAFSLSLTPTFAFADGSDDDESALLIAENDLLFQGLQGLIGGAANIIVGGDTPPEPDHLLGEIMYVYGFGLLSFALIFMIFRGIKWVFQLSSDKKEGSFLDFQSAPLPVALAVLLIMPMADGYSAVQHLVIKVFGEGISLANKEVNVAADYLDRVGTFAVNPTIMNSDLIALNMMESSICMSMLNKTSKKTVVGLTPIENIDSTFGYNSYTVSYDGLFSPTEAVGMYAADVAALGANGITKSFPEGICGSTTISFGSVDDKYKTKQAISAFREAVVSEYIVLNDGIAELGADFVEHLLEPDIDPTGNLIYNSTPPSGMENQVKALGTAFSNAYKNELSILIQKIEAQSENDESGLSNKRATESLRKYGAAYLGAYFWEYARRNNVVTALTAVKKSSKQPLYKEMSDKTSTDAYTKIYENTISFTQKVRKDYITQTPSFTGASTIDMSASLERSITKSIMEAEHPSDLDANFMFHFATASMHSEGDPILAMADTGHQLIITGEIILATSGTVIAASKLVEAGALGAAVAAASNWVTGALAIPSHIVAAGAKLVAMAAENMIPLGIILIIFGALIAFWLPSIPLIHWISGIVGLMIIFMHAFVLTPLLGLAHLLSGEKGILSSKTQHGYMAIIQLFTHAPIMVLAFFISYGICMFGLKFTQVIYLPFMTSLNGDSISGLATGIFTIGIFIIINMQIMNRCFSLVTTMTEKAGKFIGGGEEMLGDSTGADKSQGSFVAMSNSSKAGIANTIKGKEKKELNNGKNSSQLMQNINNKTK